MTTAVQITARFSPDSVYASWDEQEATDQGEDTYNAGVRCQMAEQVGTNYVRVAGDDSLRDLAKAYRRELEDIASGDLTGGEPRARVVRARLADVEREQDCRSALASSWLASDDGTHCYTAFVSRGGLEAVHRYGATPPSYNLALMLDWLNWQRGFPHVLAWKG